MNNRIADQWIGWQLKADLLLIRNVFFAVACNLIKNEKATRFVVVDSLSPMVIWNCTTLKGLL
jgi:hypothetical protein